MDHTSSQTPPPFIIKICELIEYLFFEKNIKKVEIEMKHIYTNDK